MFFNFRNTWLSLLLLFTIALASCTNEHNFDEEKPVVSLSYDSNCLNKVSTAFDLYTEELISESEIRRNFKCIKDAIDYVQVRVKGEKPGVYTGNELRNFLNKFLFKEEKKTLAFYTNLIVLKSQIFGGERVDISFQDLKLIQTFLTELEDLFVLLRPYASKVFLIEPFQPGDDFESLTSPVFNLLNRWLSFRNQNIEIAPIVNLFTEADVNIKNLDSWVGIFNLLRSSRADEKQISHGDKPALIQTLQRYYVHALKLYQHIDKGNWEYNREEFKPFHVDLDNLLKEVLASINSHPNATWKKSDLLYFVDLISEYEIFGNRLSPQIQDHLLRVVIGKYFPLRSGSIEVSSENFQKLRSVWQSIQEFLHEAKSLEGFIGTSFPVVQPGESAFSQFTQRRWPSLVRQNRTILIPDYEPVVNFTFQSLFHASWQFAAAKLLVESYSSQENTQVGLNLDEVKEAYLDVFEILKEVNFLDEESRGGWFRIFNEGNLFVPSAQANEFVSFSEAADYVAYMFSAYFAGTYIYDFMNSKCTPLSESCAFNYVQKNPHDVFESMPGLGDYMLTQMSEKSYSRWHKGFEYIAKLVGDNKPYEKSHWFRGSVANQYTEVIYRKYDIDQSDTLNFEEVSLAYIDFKEALKLLPMVKGTSAENDDSKLKAFLTLFVKKGRSPKFRNGRPTGTLIRHVTVCGGVYTSNNRECMFESDRSKIMSLLAYLTSISTDF